MANPNPSPSTRFRPGNPGGPGRPRGSVSIAAKLRKVLEREAAIKDRAPGHGATNADQLAELIVTQALAGDFRYVQFLVDKLEGADLQDELDELRRLIDDAGGGAAGDRAASGGDPGAPGG